jgi:hypothetical protein
MISYTTYLGTGVARSISIRGKILMVFKAPEQGSSHVLHNTYQEAPWQANSVVLNFITLRNTEFILVVELLSKVLGRNEGDYGN